MSTFIIFKPFNLFSILLVIIFLIPFFWKKSRNSRQIIWSLANWVPFQFLKNLLLITETELARNFNLILLENSEKEFENALNLVESLQIPHEESHRLAWESHKRIREVAELQEGLSNAQTDLLQERQHLLGIVAENDALKSKNSFIYF